MLPLTLILLLIVNLGWFYVYLASHYNKTQINEFLWSWLEIGFEPSQFTTLFLLLTVTAQLVFVVLVYGYTTHGQYLRRKSAKIKQQNRELKTTTKSHEQLLKKQAKDLSAASTLEEKVEVLTLQVEDLSAELKIAYEALSAVQPAQIEKGS